MLYRSLFFVALLFFSTALSAQTKEGEKVFPLGIIRQVHSVELNENRTLNIYLPEGYHKDSSYPVIYLLDGSADEDFIHVAGLVQFYNFPWVNVLPKSIVVGIANVDRRRDFTFPTTIEKDKRDFPTTGGSEKFIRFIEKELQPFINQSLKTNGSNMLIGQSLGGLLATEVLFKKPELFSQYIIVSPSLWWDKESLLKTKLSAFENKLSVYIAVGKEGKIMEEDAKALHELLKTKLINGTIQFEYISNKEHGNIFHQAVANAFEFIGTQK
ncbi:alpha/beta hydrolase [Lacibacter sediminis]|uniref:Alpha/beta hydrolase n=1 Tax=Lacibacter sediminis TaxID=2760713 RepID=A0A7G5XI70_9BACT|nr:alpha/beta hydrolase-fold protein [Lacibacter sediminis]QNA45173.1 alpha/beta hydrolase [Lacibacter sediminis]